MLSYLEQATVTLAGELRLAQRVLVIGFPAGLGAEDRFSAMTPIVKSGTVANLDMVPGKFLVDVQIRGGNSGSMVLAEEEGPPGRFRFCGIATSYYQADEHLAVVEPANRVLDCVYGVPGDVAGASKYGVQLPPREVAGFAPARDKYWNQWSPGDDAAPRVDSAPQSGSGEDEN